MLLSVCSLSFHTPALPSTQSQALSLGHTDKGPLGCWVQVWVLGSWLNQPHTIQLQGSCWPSQQVQACAYAVLFFQWNDLTPPPSSAETLSISDITSV